MQFYDAGLLKPTFSVTSLYIMGFTQT